MMKDVFHWVKPTPVVMNNRCDPGIRWPKNDPRNLKSQSKHHVGKWRHWIRCGPETLFFHTCLHMAVSKNKGKTSKSSIKKIGFSMKKNIHFGGVFPSILGNIDMFALEMPNSWSNWKFPSVRAWGGGLQVAHQVEDYSPIRNLHVWLETYSVNLNV